MPSRPGYPGERPTEALAFTRRGFFARASTAALAAFAVVAGAPDLARARATEGSPTPAGSGRPQPPPCRVRCEPVTKTGCACGGYLYRCQGCSSAFHACIDGRPFTWVCLRRTC